MSIGVRSLGVAINIYDLVVGKVSILAFEEEVIKSNVRGWELKWRV